MNKTSRSPQAAPRTALTPVRLRSAASWLALGAAIAASIATGDGRDHPAKEQQWFVSDAAWRSFNWNDPQAYASRETWSAPMDISLRAPEGRWRVMLSAMGGRLVDGACVTSDPSNAFWLELQLDALPASPWGDFVGRCPGRCLGGPIEFMCEQASCVGTVHVPIAVMQRFSSKLAVEVCVDAAVVGPAETREAKPPPGVSIDVTLDPFLRDIDPGDTPDSSGLDAGAHDAPDAMAERAPDAS